MSQMIEISTNNIGSQPSELTLSSRGRSLRLLILFILAVPLAIWASTQLYLIFQPNEMRPLEWVQLIVASMLFLWLAISFWMAILGFIFTLFKLDPLNFKKPSKLCIESSKLTQRHAVIMPVYNEPTMRIMAGFEANIKSLLKFHQHEQFDFYMLSDSQDEILIEAERITWQKMLAGLPEDVRARCFYRRRALNTEKKVGNLKDFFQNWGAQYCGAIVLDADSLMSGDKVLELALRLEQNDKVGLIQTIPMPVRQHTFFARFVQFSAQMHSPMLAKGLNFWQGSAANYWGHNAIIRCQAFIDCCGLPKLKGNKPFGGDIMSHDFVEAALLKREGWEVYLLTDDRGSYEEVPSNIIDYATRDRRWLQGNIQHIALLGTKGLKLTNRLHFGFGAFAYLSSICLLIILISGSADAIVKAVETPVYFTARYQLFPTWVITPHTLMITTLYVTIALLFLPKMLGFLVTLIYRASDFGGVFVFIRNSIIEFVFAVLIAPIMLLYHSYFVISVLLGKSVNWEAQTRGDSTVSWRHAIALGALPTILAIIWASLLMYFVPSLILWLLPVLTGLLLAIPIIRYSSSQIVADWCVKQSIMANPKDFRPDDCIGLVDQLSANLDARTPCEQTQPLPQTSFVEMPKQIL